MTKLRLFPQALLVLLLSVTVAVAQDDDPTPSPTPAPQPRRRPTAAGQLHRHLLLHPRSTAGHHNTWQSRIGRYCGVSCREPGALGKPKHENNDPMKLVPYINGRAIKGNYPDELHLERGRLIYHLTDHARKQRSMDRSAGRSGRRKTSGDAERGFGEWIGV